MLLSIKIVGKKLVTKASTDVSEQTEIDVKAATYTTDRASMYRGWEYWAVRAGCGELLEYNLAKMKEAAQKAAK